jgi:hypothetical protein
MPELGKVVECAEYDDEEGDDEDESGVVAGKGFPKKDEAGDEQGEGGASGGKLDGDLIVKRANGGGDRQQVSGNDEGEVGGGEFGVLDGLLRVEYLVAMDLLQLPVIVPVAWEFAVGR